MSRVVARIPQLDGTIRVVLAQSEHAARIARAIVRGDRAMIDHLHGVDGIRITTRETRS